jgi:hypothetical protein
LDLLQQKKLRPMNIWNVLLCHDYYYNQQQQDLQGQAKEDEREQESQ